MFALIGHHAHFLLLDVNESDSEIEFSILTASLPAVFKNPPTRVRRNVRKYFYGVLLEHCNKFLRYELGDHPVDQDNW